MVDGVDVTSKGNINQTLDIYLLVKEQSKCVENSRHLLSFYVFLNSTESRFYYMCRTLRLLLDQYHPFRKYDS